MSTPVQPVATPPRPSIHQRKFPRPPTDFALSGPLPTGVFCSSPVVDVFGFDPPLLLPAAVEATLVVCEERWGGVWLVAVPAGGLPLAVLVRETGARWLGAGTALPDLNAGSRSDLSLTSQTRHSVRNCAFVDELKVHSFDIVH